MPAPPTRACPKLAPRGVREMTRRRSSPAAGKVPDFQFNGHWRIAQGQRARRSCPSLSLRVMVSGSKGSAQRDPPEGRSVRCQRLSRNRSTVIFYTTLAQFAAGPSESLPRGSRRSGPRSSPRAVGRSAQHVERPLGIHARNTHLRQQLPCAPAFCARKTVRASVDAPAAL
jgi:hypothetical protein